MSPGEEAMLLDVASRGAGRAGHLAAGVDYAWRALARREAEGDAIAIARAMELVERQLQAAGRVRDAIPMLEGALARRSPSSADEADAVLLAALARARYNVGALPEQVLSAAERALPIAERLALDDLVADTLVSKAGAYRVQGRRREAEFLLRGVVGSARAVGNVDADGRALNNLALLLEGEDLSGCVVTHRQCVDLWRRLGRRSSIAFHAGNLAYSLIHAASDWDEPLLLVGELDDPDGEALDRIELGYPALEILAARGELDDERFAAHARLVASTADPQEGALLELTRARVEWCWGDFPAAIRAGMTAADFPGLAVESVFESMRGAVWLHDEATIRSVIERLDADADCSRYARAARAAARGALAGLEGRTDVSVGEYQRAIRLLREGGFGLAAAQVALDFTFLIGPEVPEARAAAEEARAVFERVRARVYLDRLDALLAGTFSADAAAPGRGSTTALVVAAPPAG